MSDKKLFLTGATGFIGSWLLRDFAAQGWTVLASGRSPAPPALLPLARYVRADICQPIPPVQAGVVIHSAALASDHAPLSTLLQANLEGTRQVYSATRACPVFIYISSSSVYDNRTTEHREDELPLRVGDKYPLLSPYGHSKRLAEDWLLEQDWRERTLIILRPRAVYGPGDRLLLPRLTKLVRAGRIILPGSMRIPISLTYVGNLVDAVWSSVKFAHAQPGGTHIFNVADARPYDLREVTTRLLSAVYNNASLPVVEIPWPVVSFLTSLLEYIPLTTPLSRLGMASVSQPNVLNLEKSKSELPYQANKRIWDVLPEIRTWVDQVGITAVQAADSTLPWTV